MNYNGCDYPFSLFKFLSWLSCFSVDRRVQSNFLHLAPEIVRVGRASSQTDVFGFGILILEVMCGRRPIEEGKPPLVEWVWQLMTKGQLLDAFDERLRARGSGFSEEEVQRVLHLGLLCAYTDPNARPSMRQVVKVLEGKNDNDEGCDESVTEEMDAHLLQTLQSQEMGSEFSHNFGYGLSSHPTFEDIRQAISTSMSLSWSDTSIVEGR
ncbi:hypothetical protein M0R45_013224 [Rubus argutus]|uniref:Serine-threonine/tyrosine-protein kinase catalytic domain-containing protein n=1 Tax=Rubus argutus TaxID=59490 RepID=A0AAW1XJ11_RUBAR